MGNNIGLNIRKNTNLDSIHHCHRWSSVYGYLNWSKILYRGCKKVKDMFRVQSIKLIRKCLRWQALVRGRKFKNEMVFSIGGCELTIKSDKRTSVCLNMEKNMRRLETNKTKIFYSW